MKPWWDRIGGDAEKPGAADARRRSVYEDRSAAPTSRIVLANGRFVEGEPCCDEPLRCERPECWRPRGGDPQASGLRVDPLREVP